MSFVKYRLKEVAADFGVAPKEIADIVGKFSEKPKSNSQVLTDSELNAVFEVMTQTHQIDSIEQVFAAQNQKAKEAPKKEKEPAKEAPKESAKEAPKQEAAPQQEAKKEANPSKAEKPKEPERKRERRVVDTSAVQVNSARFDDRVDALVSERVLNYQGG